MGRREGGEGRTQEESCWGVTTALIGGDGRVTGDRRLGGHWLVTLAGRVTGLGTPLADRVTKVGGGHQLCHWGADTNPGDTGGPGHQDGEGKGLGQRPDKIFSYKTMG